MRFADAIDKPCRDLTEAVSKVQELHTCFEGQDDVFLAVWLADAIVDSFFTEYVFCDLYSPK